MEHPNKDMEKNEHEQAQKHGGIKPAYAVAVVIVVVVLAVAAYYFVGSGPVVAAGDNISVYYTGSFTNGTIFGSNVGGQPLNFTVGANQLIKGFDQGVIGMRLNQTKNVTVPPSEGYGPINQSLIVVVPISAFGNSTPSVGMPVASASGAQGVVTAVNQTNVTVDLNSPLAGKTLVFQIRVVAIHKG